MADVMLWHHLTLLSVAVQAFAIAPFRLLFPYFGVITNLLQCCGLCSELTFWPCYTFAITPLVCWYALAPSPALP